MPTLLLSGQARCGGTPDTLLLCGTTVHGLHPSLRDALAAPNTICSLTVALSESHGDEQDRWVLDADQPVQLFDQMALSAVKSAATKQQTTGQTPPNPTTPTGSSAGGEDGEGAGAAAKHAALPTQAFAGLARLHNRHQAKHASAGAGSAAGTHRESHRNHSGNPGGSDRYRNAAASVPSARVAACTPQPGDPF